VVAIAVASTISQSDHATHARTHDTAAHRPCAGTCPLSHVYAKLSVAGRTELAARTGSR
jgi:hypothetical protein